MNINETTSVLDLVKEQGRILKDQKELLNKQHEMFKENIKLLTDDYNFTVNLLHNLNDYDTALFNRCSDMIGMFAEIYDYASNDLEDLIADLNERLGR